MRKTKVCLSTLVAASSIALSASLAPTIVWAQAVAPSVNTPSYTTVDLNARVSLTINKKLGDPGTTEPLSGITFNMQEVQLGHSLDTAEGWKDANEMTAENAVNRLTGKVYTEVTNSGGQAIFDTAEEGIHPGVYLVTEVAKGNYTVNKPFLVSLPFVENGVWKYDQTVTPKNQDVTPSKTVSDEKATLHKRVDYTIKAPVPAEDLSKFAVRDELNNALGNPAVDEVYVESNGAKSTAFVNDDHYKVTTQGQNVRVELTPAGLSFLTQNRKNDPTMKLVVKLSAEITQLPANGEITNNASVDLPNGGTAETSPINPNDPNSPSAITKLGPLTVTKDPGVNGDVSAMVGAKFKVYECTQKNSNRWEISGDAIKVADGMYSNNTQVDEFTINSGNTATVYGLQAPDWISNTANNKKYCVVETKAPAGYNLNPEPQPVTYANPSDPKASPNAYQMVATVSDQKDNISGLLPNTGEKGVWAIMIAGLLLLGGGVWSRLRHNRKQSA